MALWTNFKTQQTAKTTLTSYLAHTSVDSYHIQSKQVTATIFSLALLLQTWRIRS